MKWFFCPEHNMPVSIVDTVAGNLVTNNSKLEEHRSKFYCQSKFVMRDLEP